jgi:hypothetical protein
MFTPGGSRKAGSLSVATSQQLPIALRTQVGATYHEIKNIFVMREKPIGCAARIYPDAVKYAG